MKKVFTLMSFLMTTIMVIAQTTFSGTWHSNPGNFGDFESTVTVTTEADGKSTIKMDNMTLGNDNLGTIVIRNVYTEKSESGNTYSFSMGSNTMFDITDGNMSGVTKGVFEGYGTMDGESLYLKANYLDYGTTSLRMVVFNGTKVNTPDTPDGPTIESTENFIDRLTITDVNDVQNSIADATAVLCKYSDGTYGLTLKPVATADVQYGSVTFNGLEGKEEDGAVYVAGTVDAVFDEDSPLYGKNIKGIVYGMINEDGDFNVTVSMEDADDETFALDMEFGTDEEWEASEPVSVAGTLSSFTSTADGDFSDSKQSVLTLTEIAEDKCTITLTNGTLPGTTLTLGTVTIPNVDYVANLAESTLKLSAENIEATTEAEHPFYQTLTVKSLSATIYVEEGEDDDDEKVDVNLTFTVDNNSTETVIYTFATNGMTNGVDHIQTADGKVSHVYTLSGIGVNTLQRGVNIVRMTDGTVKKVVRR